MIFSEWRRFYTIGQILLQHGLDELIPAAWKPWPVRLFRSSLFWLRNRHSEKNRGERLRLAFEALGPVFIKFGQMLSTRRDLLPPDLADELALLQDRVPPFDGQLARQQIELALGQKIEDVFTDFDLKPLASASVAQVHTAKLRENQEDVVIKVIRPNIKRIIEDDVKLMQICARIIATILPNNRLRPVEVVEEYRRTLLDELNLMSEAANGIQLRRNFENSNLLYVPKVYSDFCHETILVMERIYGIPISDKPALEANGTNLKITCRTRRRSLFHTSFS